MNVCEVKHYFEVNNTDKIIIDNLMEEAALAVSFKNRNYTELDWYKEFISLLKTSPIIIEYLKGNASKFTTSITNLIKHITDNTIFFVNKKLGLQKIKKLFYDNLITDANAGNIRTFNQKVFSVFEVVKGEALDEDIVIKNGNLLKTLTKIFGQNHPSVIKAFKNKWEQDLFTTAFINFKKGYIVTNNEELNIKILAFKNEMLKTITLFLSKQFPDSEYIDTIHHNGYVNIGYVAALNKMEEWLRSDNILNKLYSSWLNSIKDHKYDDLFNAVSAFLSLKYFDTLLTESLGDIITYDQNNKNLEVNLHISKYQFGIDGSHQRKNWNDSADLTAILNASKYVKFILNSIPLEINSIESGENIGTSLFCASLSKLKANISKMKVSKSSELLELGKLLENLSDHPGYYASRIFELLGKEGRKNKNLREDLRTYFKFSLREIGALQSIYKYIYSEDVIDGINSAKNIESSLKNFTYSIVNSITSLFNETIPATYVETEYNSNGSMEVRVRRPYKNRHQGIKYIDLVNFSIINNQQEIRKLLKLECSLTKDVNGDTIAKIKLSNGDNLSLMVNSGNKSVGLLSLSLSIEGNLPSGITLLNKLNTLFKNTDFVSELDNILNGNNDNSALIKSVLEFIDSRLYTKFLTEDGLQILNYYRITKKNTNYLEDLLLYALKSLYVNDLYFEFNELLNDENNLEYTKLSDFKEFLFKKHNHFKNLTTSELKNYFNISEGVYDLKTISLNVLWVDDYIFSVASIQGDIASSVSKNLSGNNDANYVTKFLGGDILSTIRAQRDAYYSLKDGPAPSTSALLFVNKPEFINQPVINSDIKNREGEVKLIRKLKASELFYNAIIHNFWGSYINTGTYSILSTTYSDKPKIVLHLIDGKNVTFGENDFGGIFNGKSIHQLNKDELIELFRLTVGKSALLERDNIKYFYSQLFDNPNITFEEINAKLKEYTEDTLGDLAFSKGMLVTDNLHYINKKVNGKLMLLLNPVPFNIAKYNDINYLTSRFKTEEVYFINNLVNSGVFFYLYNHDTVTKDFLSLSNKAKLERSNNPVSKMILEYCLDTTAEKTSANIDAFMKEWVVNGKLVLAYDLEENPILYKKTNGISKMNPLLEKYFYTEGVLSNNLRLSLTGFGTNHPDKSKFNKHWDTTSITLGITNELLGNSKNIETLLNSKVIWVDPSINNFSNYNSSEFIIVNNELDSLDDNTLKTTFENIITEANELGKKILIASPILLERLSNFIDIVLTNNIDDNIDNPINKFRRNPIKKVINTGNLSISDIIALNNGYDLFSLLNSSNPEVLALATALSIIVENVEDGTLFKRNVSITATIHPVHKDVLTGIPSELNVAIINDMPAKVFNFTGESKTLDSMDGSALITAEQMILENNSLGDLAVGESRKPIWHALDPHTGVSALMKFAAFTMTNSTMKNLLNSVASQYSLYKRMMNIQWALTNNGEFLLLNGNKIWNTGDEIILGSKLNSDTGDIEEYNFQTKILGKNLLYYETYNENGDKVYKLILNFGIENGIYYTEELEVDEFRNVWDDSYKVYHLFDTDSNHIKLLEGESIPENTHTINSLYELWLTMGGLYSKNFENDEFIDSESSHEVVVQFMNETITSMKTEDDTDMTLRTYHQPLKNMMIHYLTNKSGMKNQSSNINSVDRWIDNQSFKYMKLPIDYLGILMDAEHDVSEGSSTTEPSLVTVSLSCGGHTHDIAKLVYYSLALVARINSKTEIDAITKFIHDSTNIDYETAKNELYDIIGKILLNNIESKGDNVNLTDDVLNEVEKRFNIHLDHNDDSLKIPFSDPNVYSLYMPTIISNINRKSIKRKMFGSGNILCPGYNMFQYTEIDGIKHQFSDLVRLALREKDNLNIPISTDTAKYERELVKAYLDKKLEEIPFLTYDKFHETDRVRVYDYNGNYIETLDLDDPKTYYEFRDFYSQHSEYLFKLDIMNPKNLAPARITFEANGIEMSVFDLPAFKEAYKNPSKTNRQKVQKTFEELDKGYYTDEYGNQISISNLKNKEAEMIISNMYSDIFGIKGKSLSELEELDPKAFEIEYKTPQSLNYDFSFMRSNGEDVYITFQSPRNKNNNNNLYDAYDNRRLLYRDDGQGNMNVYLIDNDGLILFQTGKFILKKGYKYSAGTYYDETGAESKTPHLRIKDNAIYEYVEFVSRYLVLERLVNNNNNIESHKTFFKYFINLGNINRVNNNDIELSNEIAALILDDIYSTELFMGININPNTESISLIHDIIPKMNNIDSSFRESVINKVIEDFDDNLKKMDPASKYIRLVNILTPNYKEYYKKLSIDRYNSWKLSNYFVAARIPAQTLQSFMKMKNVGYASTDKNVVYVSVWLLWLLGSDYKHCSR